MLPSGYIQLEYLTAETAGPFIQLNYGFDITDEVEIKTKLDNTNQDRFLVSPTTWNTSNNRFAMGGTNVSRCVGFGQQTTNYTLYSPRITPEVGQITTETYSNRLFTLTGESINSTVDVSSISFGGPTDNLKLFYGYNLATAGTIYYWKHKKLVNGVLTLVEYLVPAQRISDSVIGMYDTVTNQFFGNAGSGVFTAGPYAETIYTIKKSYYKKPSRLPSGYTELEYIESSGTQYIDTGINAQNVNKYNVTFELINNTSPFTLGGRNNTAPNYNRNYLSLGYSDQSYIGSGGTGYYAVNSIFSPNIKYNVETSIATSNAYLIINGATASWTLIGAGGEYYNGNIWLFKMNVPGSSEPAQSFKAYDIKLYNDSTLVQNLIPARRNSDLVIGMYDTISNTFFTNSGTGTFIAGNPVNTEICVKKNYYANRVLPSGYTELEYIQSSGTQYIDTGVNGTNKTAVWTATAENLSSATNTALISGGYAQTVRNCYGIFIYNDTWSTYGTGSVTATGKQNIVSTTIINTSGSTSTTIVVDGIQSSEATRIYDSSHDMNNTTLFASKIKASTMTSGGNFKLYSATCVLDDVLVRNFIPAQRISDSVIGMYDTVTNTFFPNAGTGDFTAGPAKTSYTICEIKKSHYFIGG